MIDIQKQEDNRKDIDRVGVKDISMPFVVADRDNQVQNTVMMGLLPIVTHSVVYTSGKN